MKSPARVYEVDVFRGIAIVLMVFFHFMWDMNYFGFVQINLFSGFWFWFARSIGASFMFIVGVSLVLSFMKRSEGMRAAPYTYYLFRGLSLFSWGLLITLVTWFVIGEGFIVFGILHCIGLSIILAYPFLFLTRANLIFGLLFLLLGGMVTFFTLPFPWLLWLGLVPQGFYSIDYYPLLPWFAFMLFGIYVGKVRYENEDKLRIPNYSHMKVVQIICTLGKHSLLIYLLHQPILYGLFLLFTSF